MRPASSSSLPEDVDGVCFAAQFVDHIPNVGVLTTYSMSSLCIVDLYVF
jgi:hypothetical protein